MEEIKSVYKVVAGLLDNLGIQIGFVVGVIHEIYRHNYQGEPVRKGVLVSNIFASVLMGWLFNKIALVAGFNQLQTVILISFTSLNVFLVISCLSNKDVVQALIDHYLKRKGGGDN